MFGGCVSTGFIKNMVHSIYSMSWRSGITRLLALLTVLQFLVLNFVFTALSCELFVLRRFSLQLHSNRWKFCTRFLLCKLLAFGAQCAISSNMMRLSLSRFPHLWDNWMMSEGRLRQSFYVFARISYQMHSSPIKCLCWDFPVNKNWLLLFQYNYLTNVLAMK